MVEIWLGDLSWSTALRSGDLRLVGPSELCRALPRWFTLSLVRGDPQAGGTPQLTGVSLSTGIWRSVFVG